MTFVLQDGWSPLITASFYGHTAIVKTLIKAGVNVNHANKVHLFYVHCSMAYVQFITYPLQEVCMNC